MQNLAGFSGHGIFIDGNYGVPQLLGPVPYLSFEDSPFEDMSFSQFYLEDFEDGAFNVPGVIATNNKPGGSPLAVNGPHVFADSVDADDDKVDGFGQLRR